MKSLIFIMVFLFPHLLLGAEIEGWNVVLDKQIPKEKQELLRKTLGELNGIFPVKSLNKLHQITVQVDVGNNQKTGIVKTGAYENGKIHLYSDRDCGNKILLIHEFSHAAANISIGLDNVRIKNAYQAATKLYPNKCYMMTNHREYFAEMSVVYLGKLHYFPFDRQTLKKHDPVSYNLMKDFWGEIK